MIGFAGKKNTAFFTRFITSLVLFSIVASFVVIAPKRAHALNASMQDVFPATQSSSAGVDANGAELIPLPTTAGLVYSGDETSGGDATHYIVNENNLSLKLDTNTAPTANNATFDISINLGGDIIQGMRDRDNPPNGRIDTEEDLGAWSAFYDAGNNTDTTADGKFIPAENSGNGFHLEIGTGVQTSQILDPQDASHVINNSPPVAPTLTNPLADVALDSILDFVATSQNITFTVGSNAGLQPNTQYYARIRADEDNSTAVAYSKIVAFKTTSVTENQQTDLTSNITSEQVTNQGDITSQLSCGITTLLTDCAVEGVYYLFYVPTSWILRASGWLFDVFITYSISSNMYNNPSFINTGWAIVRDIANIFFIVMLIYVAIGLILNLSKVDAKKTITSLIVMAVLVNFSLFFTKIVIDSGNIMARIFYSNIQITNSSSDPTLTDPARTGVQEKSLSKAIVNGVSVTGIISDDTLQKLNATGWHSTSSIFLMIALGIIVNLVMAWSLFIAGLLFLGRIVGLWITMIFSAFAFVSLAVPMLKVKKIGWGDWSHNLLNLSFVAPIFLFFIYLIITFINSKFLDGLLLNKGGFDYTALMVSIIVQFAILIFLIKYARMFAESLSGELGGVIANSVKGAGAAVGGFVTGAVVAVATEGVGTLGRATAGRAGAAIASSEKLKDSEAGGNIFARYTRDLGKYLGAASYDVRATKGFQGAMASAKDTIGYAPKAGKAQVGGYLGAQEKMEKDRLARLEELKTKKSAEELRFTDAGNRNLRDEYNDKLRKFDDQRSADFANFSRTRRNQPGWNEDQEKANFNQNYNNRNNPAPIPPTYKEITADTKNKEREQANVNYLRNKTIRAAVQKGTGGAITTGSRVGELNAAKTIESGISKREKEVTKASDEGNKSMDRIDKSFQGLKESIERANSQLRNITDELKNVNDRIGVPPKTEQQMRDEAAVARVNLNTLDDSIKDLQAKYKAENDPTKKSAIKSNLETTAKTRDRAKKELEDIENAYKDKARLEKAKADAENSVSEKEDRQRELAARKEEIKKGMKEKNIPIDPKHEAPLV